MHVEAGRLNGEKATLRPTAISRPSLAPGSTNGSRPPESTCNSMTAMAIPGPSYSTSFAKPTAAAEALIEDVKFDFKKAHPDLDVIG